MAGKVVTYVPCHSSAQTGCGRPSPMKGTSRPITDAHITLFFAQIVESLSQASPCARNASGPRNDDPRHHLDRHADICIYSL
jgi:hypothetical protein